MRNGKPFSAELSAFDPLARSVIGFIVRDRDRVLRAEKLQALGELVRELTHDLNTPLGVVNASSALASRSIERLRSEADPTRALAALDQATGDALRALDKISAKLDAISRFATLGPRLAICQRARDE